MHVTSKTFTVLLAVLPLVHLVAAECSVYDDADPANRDNHWKEETKMVYDDQGIFHLDKDYNGIGFSFVFDPNQDGDRAKNHLKCASYPQAGTQFKIKVKDGNQHALRSYWASPGADCVYQAPINDKPAADVYVSERCYGDLSVCPDTLEHP